MGTEDVSQLNGLIQYGALGIVTLYFIVKDFTITKELRAALTEFTNILHELKGKVN